ncbi:putative FAD-binding Berberine family protein [Hibiscus syriacus]|uniref:FAD-binding Berberine family protein n=1 Tax=Hibiscus syriacus TaxID=106335 RepID=A0A6A3AL23_HIBSY|nr:uncharacterized protein LOC120124919 isoform X2 [Hibiscus syriacus]KAE8705304.1 putative FAD-binding Berberine family protein [Hibiscus syriacus]
MESHVPSNPSEESWTEEKHVTFLNSMEAWFVRTMLDNNDRFNLRLDRHLPDTSDSTLDCKRNAPTTRNHTTSGFTGSNRCRMKVRPGKRSRRSSSRSLASSEDQVVPQVENRREDKEEKQGVPILVFHPTR